MNATASVPGRVGAALPTIRSGGGPQEIGGDETDLTEAKVWGDEPVPPAFTTFNSCQFPKPIMASIFNLGFAAPTPIKAARQDQRESMGGGAAAARWLCRPHGPQRFHAQRSHGRRRQEPIGSPQSMGCGDRRPRQSRLTTKAALNAAVRQEALSLELHPVKSLPTGGTAL